MEFMKINLYNYNFSILKKNVGMYLYIYNKYYYCLINFNKNTEIKLINQITLKIINKNFIKDVNLFDIKKLNFFIKQFNFTQFNNIKLTGKGYKIKKNSNKSIVLLFNRAHTTTL